MKRKDYLFVVLAPSPVVVAALLGNAFVDGWNWNAGGFVFLWAVLAVVALLYKLIATNPAATLAYRAAAGLSVLTAFCVFWMSIGPKIIQEENPGNLLYVATVFLGLVGVCVSRFQPARLAQVAFAMAGALLLIPSVAALLWPANFHPGYLRIQLLSSIFAAVFIASGLVFRHAAIRQRVTA